MQTEKLMELGSLLKERRLEKGFEREELAIKLKISPKTLYAIEEALVESLPQPVFARGFARSYAKMLEMNLEEVTPLINEAFPSDSIDNINPDLSAAAREQSITINQTSNTKVILLAAPIILLIIAGIGYGIYKFMGDDIKDAVTRPAVTSQNGQSQPARPAEPQVVTPPAAPAQPENTPAASAPAEAAPATTPAAEADTPTHTADIRNPNIEYPPNLVQQSNARADSPIPTGTKRVVLFAKYECWIGAEFDEVGRRSFTLEPGQIFVLDFKNKLKLTLGNAGGIDMSYNGEPFDTGGKFKESKVLNFPPQQ